MSQSERRGRYGIEREIRVCKTQVLKMEKWPQSINAKRLESLGKAKKCIIPEGPRKEHSPPDAFIGASATRAGAYQIQLVVNALLDGTVTRTTGNKHNSQPDRVSNSTNYFVSICIWPNNALFKNNKISILFLLLLERRTYTLSYSSNQAGLKHLDLTQTANSRKP